jgi:hypothetical protein
MNRAEAIAFMREAVARAPRPYRRGPAREVEPLPSDVVIRDQEEWDRRERWIVENGGMPLPVEDGDG